MSYRDGSSSLKDYWTFFIFYFYKYNNFKGVNNEELVSKVEELGFKNLKDVIII